MYSKNKWNVNECYSPDVTEKNRGNKSRHQWYFSGYKKNEMLGITNIYNVLDLIGNSGTASHCVVMIMKDEPLMLHIYHDIVGAELWKVTIHFCVMYTIAHHVTLCRPYSYLLIWSDSFSSDMYTTKHIISINDNGAILVQVIIEKKVIVNKEYIYEHRVVYKYIVM